MGSPSVDIYAVRNLDGKFKKMMNLKLACEAAKIDYPKELSEYFKDEEGEDPKYLRGRMENIPLKDWETKHKCIKNHNSEGIQGYDIDLSKLPKEIKTLRVELCF